MAGTGSASLQLTIPTFKPDSESGVSPLPEPTLQTLSSQETYSYNHVTPEIPHVTSSNPHLTTQVPHVTSQNPHLTTQIPHVTSQNPHVTSQNPHLATQIPHVTSPYGVMTSPSAPGSSPFQNLPPLKTQQMSQGHPQILNAQGFT